MSTAILSPLNMMELNCYCDDDDDFVNAISNLGHADAALVSPSIDDLSVSVPSLSDDNDVEMEDVEHDATLTREGIAVSLCYGGLRNLGNTCYMNSGLQMLASLDKFNAYLREMALEELKEEKLGLRQEYLTLMEQLQSQATVRPEAFKTFLDIRSHLFVGYRQQDCHEFTTTLLDLLGEDYKKENTNFESNDDIQGMKERHKYSESIMNPCCEEKITSCEIETRQESPIGRLHSLSALNVDDISKLLHGTNNDERRVMSKETATEQPSCKLVGGRAVAVLDERHISNFSEASTTAAIETSKVDEKISRVEVGELSPVEEYFATEVRACLTCDSCKYSRSHMEKFLCLSLDISNDSGSVDEGLRKFFAPEKREIKCEKCFSEVGATSTMEITRLPRALLVHFKRFIVELSPDYSSITYRKNQSQVDFPERLPLHEGDGFLSEFLASDVTIPERSCSSMIPWVGDDASMYDVDARTYNIRSVVNHIGSSASCGHYTADSSRLYHTGERKWTRFNDSVVSSLSKDEAMGAFAKKTAYMVMYELE